MRDHDEDYDLGLGEYQADLIELRREAEADYINRPGRGGLAPADFINECPAARRER